MSRLAREDWPLWLLILATLGAGLVLLPRLHAPVPVHWGVDGKPNGFEAPLTAVLVQPLVAAGVYLLLAAVPAIDPRRASYAAFAPTYRIVRWLIVLLMVGVQSAVLLSAAGVPVPTGAAARAVLAVLLLVLGNSIGRVRPNWFIGIRTPWTLSSDEVWRDTHRLAAPCMVVAGLLSVPLVFVHAPWATAAEIGLLLAALLVPAAYSYFRYQR
jgi:uncharacterized membrane protein